jgi:hypothetical protein
MIWRRYSKVIVVEYSAKKQEVNKLALELPNGKGKGTGLGAAKYMGSIFDREGKANDYIDV